MGTRIVAGKLRAVAGIRISDFDSAAYLQKHAVPRAKQYIDDFKRGIYMEVQRRINTRENNYICLALEDIVNIEYVGGSKAWTVVLFPTTSDLESMLESMFSEFFRLFNGYRYSPEEVRCPTYKHEAWFVRKWKEPRIRIIDYILHI